MGGLISGIKSQNNATFNPVKYCHPTEGGLYPGGGGGGGGGGLITGCIFCFQLDGPITGGGLISAGLITGILRYFFYDNLENLMVHQKNIFIFIFFIHLPML